MAGADVGSNTEKPAEPKVMNSKTAAEQSKPEAAEAVEAPASFPTGQPQDDGIIRIAQISVELPTGKSVNLQVPLKEQVLEIIMQLMELPESCYFSSFYLTCAGTRLNEYAPLDTYKVFVDAQAAEQFVHLKLVNDLYDESSSREHVRRLRELLVNPPMHIVEKNMCYLPTATPGFANSLFESKTKGKKASEEVEMKPEPTEKTNFDLSLQGMYAPERSWKSPTLNDSAEGVLPAKEASKDVPKCLQYIAFSALNPPPGYRVLEGDLWYLEVMTLNDVKLFITAAVDGFFLNTSTDKEFNPEPAPVAYKSHCLVDLLRRANPQFQSQWNNIMNRKVNIHPYENIPVLAAKPEWCVKRPQHGYDWNRAEKSLVDNFGVDPNHAVRDWNTEYQGCREEPFVTPEERLRRDRLTFGVYSMFVQAATKGAMAIVKGHITPMNPGEAAKSLVYIYNNIFFSFATDMRSQYADVGGDAVAYAMANHDLKGVTAIRDANVHKLFTLAQCVINYRGHRLVAQSIIPGIFHEKSSKHLYGSMDNQKHYKTDPEFAALLTEAAKSLHIKKHKIMSKVTDKAEQAQEVELVSSAEMKGMTGFDSRMYVLDCIRVTPRDANFENPETHPAALIRPELLTTYCRQVAYSKVEQKAQAEREAKGKSEEESKDKDETAKPDSVETKPDADANKDDSEVKTEEKKELSKAEIEERKREFQKAMFERMKELNAEAARQERDYLDNLSSVQFNTDCFTSVTLAGTEEENKKDEEDVRELAKFLQQRLGQLLLDLVQLREIPADGEALTDLLHSRGVNMRYLGRIAKFASSHQKETPILSYVADLTVLEMVTRACKHKLSNLLREVRPQVGHSACAGVGFGNSTIREESWYLAPTIAKFLSSLLGKNACGQNLSDEQLEVAKSVNESNVKGGKKKQARLSDGSRAPDDPLAPANLWQSIRASISQKFDEFDMPLRLELDQRQRLILLRGVCKACGIQVVSRDYEFDADEPVRNSDIIDLVPIVKSNLPKSKDALDSLQRGKYELRVANASGTNDSRARAFHYCAQALDTLEQSVGPMNAHTADAYATLAKVFLAAKEYQLAIEHQQKALIINQRVHGLDHYTTAYSHSAMANILYKVGVPSIAIPHAQRALYLYELICGPQHPLSALSHVNLAMCYQQNSSITLALRHLEEALSRYKHILSPESHYVALCHHHMALSFSLMGHFRLAILHEKKAKAMWSKILGPQQQWTKLAVEYLAKFTECAVMMAKGETRVNNFNTLLFWMPVPEIGSVDSTMLHLSMLEAQNESVRIHEQGKQQAQEMEEIRARMFEAHGTDNLLEIQQPKEKQKKTVPTAMFPDMHAALAHTKPSDYEQAPAQAQQPAVDLSNGVEASNGEANAGGKKKKRRNRRKK